MRTLATVALVLAATVSAASARMEVFHRSGNWNVAVGKLNDGKPSCSMGSLYSNGAVLSKWSNDGDHLFVQLFKDSWAIPTGTKIEVDIGIDRQWPWSVDGATGRRSERGSSFIEFNISAEKADGFLSEFRE